MTDITLSSLLTSGIEKTLYDIEVRNVIEDHLVFLISHPKTVWIDIKPEVAYKGDGDLISVLLDYDIDRHLHWVIMRVNGYTSPMQYRSTTTELMIPDPSVILNIIRTHNVSKAMIK